MLRTPVIFPPTLELSTLDGIIGAKFNGVLADDYSGYSVASAGDINGDGLSDLIIGAYQASPGGRTNAGSSFVIFGTNENFGTTLELAALNGTNGFRINGVLAGDLSGTSVASMGDINGDGLSDLIIGANKASPGGRSNAGSSFIVFGTKKSFGAVVELSTLNGTNGFRINGVSAVDNSGNSVASAGDVNGDGLSDLIIGARSTFIGSRSSIGSTFVVFGTAKIFGAVLELSALNGTNGFRINGVSTGDFSGYSVASAGDINGDGFGDLIIGAYGASPGGRTNAGSSFVIFGTNKNFGATLELAALNGTNGFRINGALAGDWSGYSVAGAGDINGDSLNDLIIGAPSALFSVGSSFIVFGARAAFGATLELSSLNGANGFRINGISAPGYSGSSGSSVASAGDMNNDGLSDLIIGAYKDSPGGRTNAGSSFVVFGTNENFGATFKLSALNGTNGFRINGVSIGDFSGTSVASAGDINGDGLSDLIIGAYLAGPGGRIAAGSSFVVFGDNSSAQITVNQMTISEGASQILTTINLNASASGSPDYIYYSISALLHGKFEYTTQPGVAITRFSYQDVIIGRVNFTHDDSELAPSYLVIASHRLAVSISPANITFNNQLPILINNSLIVNQGQRIQLDNTMLAAVDLDNPQHNPNIIFTIAGTLNGFFSSYSFSQKQLWNGEVNFTPDNSIRAPQYTVNISRGGVNIGPNFPEVDFDIMPVFSQNRFDICQGQTKAVTSNMLSAIHPGANSSDTLIFSIKYPQYSQYSHFERINAPGIEISTFSQAEVKNSSVQLVHDGSSNPSNFMITISDNRITTPSVFATLYFTFAPIIRSNTLTLNQGQTVVFDKSMLNAVDSNNLYEDLMFTVSNVKQGTFIHTNISQNITQFNQSQLNARQIAFETDGNSLKPSYLVSVQNRCSQTQPTAADINFNSAPVLTNNQLTITNGQPRILTSIELSANDRETPLVDLGFTISGIQHGYFDTITLPGTPITVFPQQMVFNGVIRFVPENDFLLPAYNVSVSDGVLWGGPKAALVRLSAPGVNTFTATVESSNTVRNAIIGGALSGLIGLGFFVFKFCLSKRMNGALKNILVVEGSTVEQEQEEWRRETLLPVVKEVFSRFKTTGFIGYRNEANTKAYLRGVELILLEIKKHGVEVHFPKLSVTERIRLLTAIVDEIKIQLVAGSSSSFIQPAFTPSRLKDAAIAIAKVVAMTVKKETVADRIRHTVVQRPDRESSSYPVMVRDNNEIELESVTEQKFASEASNQALGGQASLETRLMQIREDFSKSLAKSEERFSKFEARVEERSAKIEASLEELLGRQPEAIREQPKMRLVR